MHFCPMPCIMKAMPCEQLEELNELFLRGAEVWGGEKGQGGANR
jgi:hypothetical protein